MATTPLPNRISTNVPRNSARSSAVKVCFIGRWHSITLWRNRDFLKLWTGQMISELGSRITRDGLPLAAVLVLHATPAPDSDRRRSRSSHIAEHDPAGGHVAHARNGPALR